jgi:spore coat polysaccharide biosynthesis protein SpsF
MDNPRYTRVVVGIQAKTDLPKFPGMVSSRLEGKRVLDWVIDHAVQAARYLNHYRDTQKLIVTVALAIPTGDPIRAAFANTTVRMVEGSDEDVLQRFVTLAESFDADLLVRLSADCPMLPPFVIVNHIKKIWKGNYDYVSNVDERCRLVPDGWDCEAFSRELLQYTHENAKLPDDRMHVTTFMRNTPPEWARIGHEIGYVNLSQCRFRTGTPEDLEHLRSEMKSVRKALEYAEEMHGKESIGRH